MDRICTDYPEKIKKKNCTVEQSRAARRVCSIVYEPSWKSSNAQAPQNTVSNMFSRSFAFEKIVNFSSPAKWKLATPLTSLKLHRAAKAINQSTVIPHPQAPDLSETSVPETLVRPYSPLRPD